MWNGARMWREGIFAETFCLSFWMNPLSSFQNSTWRQSEADSSWLHTKNISGDYVPPFLFLCAASYGAQPDYQPHSPGFWLGLLISISALLASGQGPEHTFRHCCEDQWDKASGTTTRMSSLPLFYSSCVPGYLTRPGNLSTSVFLWVVQRRGSINMAESACQCKEDFGHEEQLLPEEPSLTPPQTRVGAPVKLLWFLIFSLGVLGLPHAKVDGLSAQLVVTFKMKKAALSTRVPGSGTAPGTEQTLNKCLFKEQINGQRNVLGWNS